ncbi:MAG: hypothetical protein ABR925_04820 [Acidimicrobiales bacterium]
MTQPGGLGLGGMAAATVGLGMAWAWLQLRSHVLRKVGAVAETRRQTLSHLALFPGLFVMGLIAAFVPRPAGHG